MGGDEGKIPLEAEQQGDCEAWSPLKVKQECNQVDETSLHDDSEASAVCMTALETGEDTGGLVNDGKPGAGLTSADSGTGLTSVSAGAPDTGTGSGSG